jgi:hypothetical protein
MTPVHGRSQFVRLTTFIALGSAAFLWMTGIVRADLPRTPVRSVPRLFGRNIERFVLLAPIVVDRSQPGVPFSATPMIRMLPGTFIPVTEDAEGIFYQAVNEFRSIRGSHPVGGGIYVSKSREGVIWMYIGDAQMNSKQSVLKDRQPLPASALRNLKVGKTDRGN